MLTRVQEVQTEVSGNRKRPCGLPAWHIKGLCAFAADREGGRDLQGLLQETTKFEMPNTPQHVLETCAWRCGKEGKVEPPTDDDMHDCPLLYGSTRQAVWYGGHQMVVENVCSDPRVAFIHNLVTPEEALELITAARNVGLKQSLVGNMKERYNHAVAPSAEEIREEAAREGRTSTSCRVDRTLPVSAAIVLRVAHLLGMSPYCSEAVQVVRYQVLLQC